MILKARKPETIKPSKPKFLISGESGVGKTCFALDFPKPYLIDTESGATRPQYQEKLKKVNGAYFGKEEGAQDFDTVLEEVKQLATTKHEYKTLIIDSFSYLYLLEAAEAELSVGSDFGRDKKEANKPTRQLIRWIEKLDMTVILICHSKPKWVRRGKEVAQEGNTFDGYDKLEYILDLWIEIAKGGKTFMIQKSRISSLPQGSSLPLSYEKFAEVYGQEVMEADPEALKMATPEQIKLLKEYVEVLNVDIPTIDKWMKKVDVESFEDMTSIQLDGLLNMLKDKINKLKVEAPAVVQVPVTPAPRTVTTTIKPRKAVANNG